jgi:hypothetical protein
MKSEYFSAIPESKIRKGLGWHDKCAAYRIEGIWYQKHDFEQTTCSFDNYEEAINDYKKRYSSDPYENVLVSIERMGGNDYGYKYVGCYLGPDIYGQFLENDSVTEFYNL